MNDDFPIAIFHNPDCGTSRNTLAIIRAAGYEPSVIEYLKTGWTREQLVDLIKVMPARPLDLVRDKGTPARELGLFEEGVSDEAIIEAMIANPIVVNRPIVVTPLGVKLCRPSELVLELLDRQPERFTKEDGKVVIPPPRRF